MTEECIISSDKKFKDSQAGGKHHDVHQWVRRHLQRPDLCQICNNAQSCDLTNVTHIYTRDFKNWKHLCRSCRVKFHGTGFQKGHGHYSIGFGFQKGYHIPSWNKGKKLSEEHKRKLREAAMRRNRESGYHSEETRRKISEALRARGNHSSNHNSKRPHLRRKYGKAKHQEGYMRVFSPDHRYASKNGYVFEHRIVYEAANKCCLLRWAVIHHINGIKDDNRPENLEAYSNGKHVRLYSKLMIENTKLKREVIELKGKLGLLAYC
jgi:hypothetical protein